MRPTTPFGERDLRAAVVRCVAGLLLAAGCSSGGSEAGVTSTSTTAVPTTTGPSSTTATAVAGPAPVVVSIRVEDRTSTEPGFRDEVLTTLTDPRGWQRAGFAFAFDDPDAPYAVVLAEAAEVDALCLPYDTFGLYSCQNGPVVALNADRWRTATPEWTGDLAAYRQMLVVHEVGHLLGQHHPAAPQCPAPGDPAPVMAQQSTELDGCLPNPWPLPWELDCAAEHVEPLAPPYDPDVEATCAAQR